MICEQSLVYGKPVVYIWYRQNGEKRKKVLENISPYFYVGEKEQQVSFPGIIKVESGYQDIWDRPVKKIVCRTPKDVAEVRKNYGYTYESDIKYNLRVYIDSGLSYTEKPKFMYLDIEIMSPEGVFPDVWEKTEQEWKKACKYPIKVITTFDEVTNEYHCFLLNKEKQFINEKYHWENLVSKKLDVLNIHYYLTERDLLYNFMGFVERVDTDVFSGWYIDMFDMPYIFNRMDILGIDKNRISPLRYVYMKAPSYKPKIGRVEENPPEIKGRMIFDLLKAYKISHSGELEARDLGSVSLKILGLQKVKHDRNIFSTLQDDIKLIKYNVRDVELVKEIDKKLKISDFFWELSVFIGCRLDQTFSESQMIDTLWLREAKFVLNKILPTKSPTAPETFEGAYVMNPSVGIHDWVILLDLKQLYPSIIRTFNMSPETILEEEYPKELTIELPNGIKFKKDKLGITPGILKKLFEVREINSREMNKYDLGTQDYENYRRKAQHAKDISNSYYGVLAYSGSRLYAPNIGKSITYMGQQILKWCIKKSEEKGYKILYGDTDSIFVQAKGKTKEDCINEGNQLSEFIDSTFNEFVKPFNVANHYFHIDFKEVHKRIIFIAKKRYMYLVAYNKGRTENNYIASKGLETRRSDNNDFTKKFVTELYETVLRWEKDNLSRQTMIDYLINLVIEKKKELKILSVTNVAIKVGFNKDIYNYANNSPYSIGAVYSNKYFKTKINKGSKPYFVYIKNMPKGYPKNIVVKEKNFVIKGICFDFAEQLPQGIEIDYEEMERRLILDRADILFKALDIDTEVLYGQSNLMRFYE